MGGDDAGRWVDRARVAFRRPGSDGVEAPRAGSTGEPEPYGTVADCAVYDGGRRRGGRLTVPAARAAAPSVRAGVVWLGRVEPSREISGPAQRLLGFGGEGPVTVV